MQITNSSRDAEYFDYPPTFPRKQKLFSDLDENATFLPREHALASFQQHPRYYSYGDHFIVWEDMSPSNSVSKFRFEVDFSIVVLFAAGFMYH